MEYTIYNESLVNYALRNKDGYMCFIGGTYRISHDMKYIVFFSSVQEANDFREELEDVYTNLQIRKVKVIDIGEVNG